MRGCLIISKILTLFLYELLISTLFTDATAIETTDALTELSFPFSQDAKEMVSSS